MTNHRPRLAHEQRVTWLVLAGGLPAVTVAIVLLWSGGASLKTQWTLTLLLVGCWLGFALGLRNVITYSLRTLSNLLAALREGDYSLRVNAARQGAFGDVAREVNLMGEMLRQQRLSAIEAASLLQNVIQEIDVAVFAFDGGGLLRLVNRAGERLLGRSAAELLNHAAPEIGLAGYLDGESIHTVERSFPGASGRWRISRRTFRERGVAHELLVISDLTRELREEELRAWQRLVRVLSHELNNSLAPIKSLTGSLRTLLDRPSPAADWKSDMREGLEVIGSRADSLGRFTSAYARLARMPAAQFAPLEVKPWLQRLIALRARGRASLLPGPEVTIHADAAQLEQLLINLLHNAFDAAIETSGGVRCGWTVNESAFELWVEDDGPGLSNDANLFVPFFTTKPGGSGIGLVLGRKVAENHGGSLTLRNREDGQGCRATLRLPTPFPGQASHDWDRKIPPADT